MTKRKGVFIGAYIAAELKDELTRRAKTEHRTLSQQITKILTEALRGNGAAIPLQDRRSPDSAPRRRASDPGPRRRSSDVTPNS